MDGGEILHSFMSHFIWKALINTLLKLRSSLYGQIPGWISPTAANPQNSVGNFSTYSVLLDMKGSLKPLQLLRQQNINLD